MFSQKRSEVKLGSIKMAMVEMRFAGRLHFDSERDNGLFQCTDRALIVAFMNGNVVPKLFELKMFSKHEDVQK